MKKQETKVPKGCAIIIGIVIVLLFLYAFGKCTSSLDTTQEKAQTAMDSTTNAEPSSFIGGISPVDVYLNMEKIGFETEKDLSEEYGNMWTSSKSYEGMDCKVNTYSTNIDSVISVRAWAMVDLAYKNITATKQFIMFVATLPYDGANPELAQSWVNKNFDNDKSSTTIGTAKFTIYAPSVAVRMLDIEKAGDN